MMRVAVLTSGGDAPGMNAAIRAVVRRGLSLGLEIYGVRRGYSGLMAGEFVCLGSRDVGGIIERGGTVLGTSRCPAFLTAAGQEAAVEQLAHADIQGLVVIGGNGSQAGANALAQRGIAVVGIASTIDNDLAGSDITLGATTALDIALEAIDRLRVTASSHGRVFLVEVMGRHCGYLALIAGITGGAEAIVTPESDLMPENVAHQILQRLRRLLLVVRVVVDHRPQREQVVLQNAFLGPDDRLLINRDRDRDENDDDRHHHHQLDKREAAKAAPHRALTRCSSKSHRVPYRWFCCTRRIRSGRPSFANRGRPGRCASPIPASR